MVTAKTQVRIGQLAAIIQAALCLLRILTTLFITRHTEFIDPPDIDMELQMLGPIVLSNVLGMYLCICYFLALVRRLFKTSLCLAMVYTILFVVRLFRGEYFDLGDFVSVVLEGVIIFLLFQGIIGVRKEKLKQWNEASAAGIR